MVHQAGVKVQMDSTEQKAPMEPAFPECSGPSVHVFYRLFPKSIKKTIKTINILILTSRTTTQLSVSITARNYLSWSLT